MTVAGSGAPVSLLLTIGVPTYNRSGDVRELLGRLEAEMPEGAPVEVLVSDNASPDDTREVVQSMIGRCRLNLRYARNDENLGYDGNIDALYRKANGRYIWFLSDDDLIEPGGIGTLLRHLSAIEPCGLVVCNTRNGFQDGQWLDLVPYFPCGEGVHVRVGVRAAVTDERERLATLMAAGQVSTCVVLRSGEEVPKGPGGGHMHERLANLSLLRTPHYYIVPEPIIAGGAKYWSYWFMEAVLYGIRELYTAPDMVFSKRIADVATTQTCKAGLRLLAMRYWRALVVDYPEIDDGMVARLERTYGDAYPLIARDVERAVRARRNRVRDRLLFLSITPFYYAYKAWQIYAWPRCRWWLRALQGRVLRPCD